MLFSPWARVGTSPWPILVSFMVGSLLLSLVIWCWGGNFFPVLFSGVVLGLCAAGWIDELILEGTFTGMYTSYVVRGLKWATWLFIFSEIMFFFSFFWAFAHSAVVPSFEFGCTWPPPGIKPIHPFGLPFFNMCVLVTSSLYLNLASGFMRISRPYEASWNLLVVICLSGLFFYAQLKEYKAAWFTITDGVFGSTFYMLTGFHGFHVFVGTVVLMINFWRLKEMHFHTGFNIGWMGGVWYWHFVDLVWIIIWLVVYCWGSWGGKDGYYPYF